MSSKVWNWLSDHLWGTHAENPASTPAPSAQEMLEALTGEVQNLQVSVKRVDLDDPEAAKRLKEALAEEARRAEQEKMNLLHRQMRADIVAALADLKAGIDGAALDALAQKMDYYTEEFTPRLTEKGARGDMFRAVISRIYWETGLMAWPQLNELMERAGKRWPDPDSLSPSITTAELEAERAKQLKEVEQDFIYGKARLALLHGSVPIWRAAYPDQGTSLWDRTVLRGAGVALRAKLLGLALDELYRREDEVRALAVSMVEGPLANIRKALAQGVSSLEQANKLLDEAQDICRKQISDRLWEMVKPIVHA